jgi:1-acyl-sn-glycerol-3-phosphate acyltransferase
MDVFAVFPEGAEGNCKPFWRAYRMAPWRTGFVRLALARDAQIVPWCILGGEECLPTLSTIRVLQPLLGSIAPLPLTPLPLPTRWKIIVLPPIHARTLAAQLKQQNEIADDQALWRAMADHVRALVQTRLDEESGAWLLGRIGKTLSRSQAGLHA